MPDARQPTEGGIDVLLRGVSSDLEDFVVAVLSHGFA
jgi:hypothetical protein